MSPFCILLELRMMEMVDGDSWSYETCKAPVKSLPPTNQCPTFYRMNALPVAQPTVSEQLKQQMSNWTQIIVATNALPVNFSGGTEGEADSTVRCPESLGFIEAHILQTGFPSSLWHCWLGNREGTRPVRSWVLVCWWWQFDWSFARLHSSSCHHDLRHP